MKEINKDPIWLIEDSTPSIITKGTFRITDEKLFDELLKELNNIDTYIYTGDAIYDEPTSEQKTFYTSFGAKVEEPINLRCHRKSFYTNPRAQIKGLMTGDSHNDLINLFTSGSTVERRLEELKNARTIIDYLTQSSIDSQTIKLMITQMWPNFGFFATEYLRCTEIEPENTYSLEDIKAISAISKRNNVSVDEQVTSILRKEELAERNGKILQLARQAQRISTPSK